MISLTEHFRGKVKESRFCTAALFLVPRFVLLGSSFQVFLIISAVKSDNGFDALCSVEETVDYQQI